MLPFTWFCLFSTCYSTSPMHYISFGCILFFVSDRVCKADFRNSFQNWTVSDSITFPEATQDNSGRADSGCCVKWSVHYRGQLAFQEFTQVNVQNCINKTSTLDSPFFLSRRARVCPVCPCCKSQTPSNSHSKAGERRACFKLAQEKCIATTPSVWQEHKHLVSCDVLLVMKVNILPAKALCPFITDLQHQKIISKAAKSFKKFPQISQSLQKFYIINLYDSSWFFRQPY